MCRIWHILKALPGGQWCRLPELNDQTINHKLGYPLKFVWTNKLQFFWQRSLVIPRVCSGRPRICSTAPSKSSDFRWLRSQLLEKKIGENWKKKHEVGWFWWFMGKHHKILPRWQLFMGFWWTMGFGDTKDFSHLDNWWFFLTGNQWNNGHEIFQWTFWRFSDFFYMRFSSGWWFLTILKTMSSSMGRMTSHISWNIKKMFETTNQIYPPIINHD